MVINALCKYYDIIATATQTNIPTYGYSYAPVGYALYISETGHLLDVISLKSANHNAKRLINRQMILPERVNRSSNICANYMSDNCKYMLGIDKNSLSDPDRFKAFKDLHQEILQSATGSTAQAVLNFLQKWDIEQAFHHPIIINNCKDLTDGSNIVFKIENQERFAHDDQEIRMLWEKHLNANQTGRKEQCLITGQHKVIAKLHPKIKNVLGTKSSGAAIVSFNEPAYVSYGKSQGYNAPISQQACFAYTTVLNYMLANHKQKIQIGDATTVFWAETTKSIYLDLAAALFNPQPTASTQEEQHKNDVQTERIIKDVLSRTKAGLKIGDVDANIDGDTKFYILGLSPNASRISIRYFYADNFGNFVTKMAQHYADLEIIKEFNDQPTNIPIWMLIKETTRPVAKNSRNTSKPQPLLAGAVMRAIITGSGYPTVLYNAIMLRIRADQDDQEKNIRRINYIRAAIIKAYLLRKARLQNDLSYKEVLTVSLNEQSQNSAYLLGRLFAVLESAQKDANPGINATIKDRYFTSACATPAAVFPILLKLVQHHMAKSDYGFISDKRIENIMDKLTAFPSYLNLDQQGLFVLGYYHQRAALYKKSTQNQEGGF